MSVFEAVQQERAWSDLFFGDNNAIVKILLHVVKKDNKFLVSIPGGKRHLGEDSILGAMREAKEETGFKLRKEMNLGSIQYGETGEIFFFRYC
jgi:8-oxo-dGTP pyrophosphatase MutT (NUDIX family)